MGYLATHLRNVVEEKQVSPMDLEPGPIYDIRYKSETASKNRYIVVALNIYPYTGPKKDRLLHCLDMDAMSLIDVKRLAIKAEGVQKMDIDGRGTIFWEFNMPNGRKNREFYAKNISKFMNQVPNVYKTLKIGNMNTVKICNYDFTKVLDSATLKKFGLIQEDIDEVM